MNGWGKCVTASLNTEIGVEIISDFFFFQSQTENKKKTKNNREIYGLDSLRIPGLDFILKNYTVQGYFNILKDVFLLILIQF